MTSYLTNRYQKVVIICESESKFHPVLLEVSQGSILGPLHFIIYSNDLSEVIHNAMVVVLYADDMSVIAKHKNKHPSQLFWNQFEQLTCWFWANGLKLNADKTDLTIYLKHQNTAQSDSTYLQSRFNVVSSARFMEIEIGSNLTWREHIIVATLKFRIEDVQLSFKLLSNYLNTHSLKPRLRNFDDNAKLALTPLLTNQTCFKWIYEEILHLEVFTQADKMMADTFFN